MTWPPVVEMMRPALWAAIAAALATASVATRSHAVAIINVTVIEGRGGPARPNSTVVVADGVITTVSRLIAWVMKQVDIVSKGPAAVTR